MCCPLQIVTVVLWLHLSVSHCLDTDCHSSVVAAVECVIVLNTGCHSSVVAAVEC